MLALTMNKSIHIVIADLKKDLFLVVVQDYDGW